MKYITAMLIGVFLSSQVANGGLVLTIDNYTTDELSFSISGTFDTDTTGQYPGYLAIKNDWSNNYGIGTDFFNGTPTISLNTLTVDGLIPPLFYVQDQSSAAWGDNFHFYNPNGGWQTPFLAGTEVSGSVTLSQVGGFDPNDQATLELLSGFNGNGDWHRLETTAVPEPASLGLLGLISGGIYFSRRFFRA